MQVAAAAATAVASHQPADVHRTVLKRWINAQIKSIGRTIDNLNNDLIDGCILIELVQKLSSKRIRKFADDAQCRDDKLANVRILFLFLKAEHVPLDNIGKCASWASCASRSSGWAERSSGVRSGGLRHINETFECTLVGDTSSAHTCPIFQFICSICIPISLNFTRSLIRSFQFDCWRCCARIVRVQARRTLSTASPKPSNR